MIKRQKGKHRYAFEYWYLSGGFASKRTKKEDSKRFSIKRGSNFYKYFTSLSGRRSLLKTARAFNVSRTAVNNWYKVFNWERQAFIRDNKVNKMVNERLKLLPKERLEELTNIRLEEL